MEITKLFEQYETMLKEQCALDDLNLKDVQMKLPANKHYWASRCIAHKRDLAKLQRQKDDIKREMIKRIGEEAEVELSKTALDRKISQLDEVRKFDKEIEDMEQLILFVEKAEKIVQGMGWDIKNIIELQKLETL